MEQDQLTASQVREDQVTAIQRNNHWYSPGMTPAMIMAVYTDFAEDYDRVMGPHTYLGPVMAAEEVARVVPQERRRQARVLDVAAGTGKVGLELYRRGFTLMDAMEPSAAMLEKLKTTGVYRETYQQYLGEVNSSLPQGTYDVVVTSGGMGEGHIPPEGLDDMVLLTRSGGVVVIVMRREFLQMVESYRDTLEPRMKLLEQRGQWHREGRKELPNYFCDKEGVVFTYRVL